MANADRLLRIGHRFDAGDPHVRSAIESGDRAWLSRLVRRQLSAGADLVDVNVAALGAEAPLLLPWCIGLAESAGGRAVMIDCADAELLCATAEDCAYPPWLNSLDVSSPWPVRLPQLLRRGCRLVIQLRDGERIPTTAQERMQWCERALARCSDFAADSIWIDAVALPFGDDLERGRSLLAFLEAAHARWPQLPVLVGLSNLSFGHRDRSAIHRLWLAELGARWLRGALLDPFDPALAHRRS
jgi:5-methyltetrahydrofolate--homocysteine methyltransferase